jgi:hypothetical protein
VPKPGFKLPMPGDPTVPGRGTVPVTAEPPMPGMTTVPGTRVSPPGTEGESDEPLGLIAVVPFGSVFCTVPGSGVCG